MIEFEIGYMKMDGCLLCCLFKGIVGDVIFVVFCGCGYNICKIFVYFRVIWVVIIGWLFVNLNLLKI